MDAAIFGLIVADVIAEPMDLHKHLPPAGALQVINSVTLTTGGNVCNTGVAMAKMGMKVVGAGMVGDDLLGKALLERLRLSGLDTSAVFTSDCAPTSATVAAVETGGERCFFHAPGVTALLDAALFRKCFPIFRECAYMQIGYFGLLPTLTPDLPELLAEFRSSSPGTKIALDTSNPPEQRKLLVPILPHLDIFCPSRTEAEVLSGESKPAKMVAFFRQYMPKGLIGIKLDAKGCYLDNGQEAVTVPSFKIKVVDSTGAGDTWFAGLLTALRHNMPLERAGRFANRAAADCCLAIGASTGVKSFEETLARAQGD
jgi:sugar/nucleoside kinase (ribokinase family)